MILDFADFKRVVRGVLAEYDHRNWNDFIPYPSVENICELLRDKLAARLAFPFTLRVWEGEGKWAEI
jgi:6-pyruvoyltetrahydropterin/6-carboxytetrahydropterin synthase